MEDRLYGYQKRFLEDHSQFRIVNKSRQIGFSFAIALEGLYVAEKIPNHLVLYCSVGERQAKELLRRIRAFGLAQKLIYQVDSASELGLANGSRIISLPNNPDTIVGYSPDRVYLDEFSHYKREKRILQALGPSLMRTDKRRFLTVVSTPLGQQGEFYRLWEKGGYSRHEVNILQAIEQGCPADVDTCRALVPDDLSFRQEYMCAFVDDAISYFPYDLIKQCWNADLENAVFDDLKHCPNPLYAGYDPAKVVDSGVFAIVERRADKAVVRHLKEWSKTDYSEQLAYIERYSRGLGVAKLITDQTGVGGKIQEDLSRSLGGVSEGIPFTNATKEAMITNLRVMFQDGTIEIPYDQNLVNQLHGLKRMIGNTGVIRYSHEEGNHDDYVWALAMACYGFSGRVANVNWSGLAMHFGEELISAPNFSDEMVSAGSIW